MKPSLGEPLSKREMQIARLIVEGKTNQEIADQFTVTLDTVKSQVYHLFVKIGVHSRREVASRLPPLADWVDDKGGVGVTFSVPHIVE
jgi:DNA-binding CsgD family transcriptional regulator